MTKGRRRQNRTRSKRQGQQRLIIGAVALAAVLVIGIFVIANRPGAESAYYQSVKPAELERIVKGNEPVLVYFHSPT